MSYRTQPAAIFAAVVLSSVLVSPLQAQQAEQAWEDDPIVVTPNRTEQQAATVPARVSVITREQIERSQAPDLAELLRLEAGVDVSRNGGPGGQTSVFLRGTNSNHVLVLIDGVRAAASGTGAFTWEILDPALIERIEIVRGPRAARWGSDAIGGVIQIFTRREDGGAARAAYGSDRDRAASAAFGMSGDGTHVDAAAAWRKVAGFSAQNEDGFGFDPDDDGFENASFATGGRTAIGQGDLNWRARIASGDVEFDQGETDFENWSGRIDYRHQGDGAWTWQAGVSTLRDRLDTTTAFSVSEAVTRRLQADWMAERALGSRHQLLVGLDAWRESGSSAGQWRESRSNIGVFSGLEGSAGTLSYELSLRADDDENFGSEVTGSAGLNWQASERWRAFASVGRAFRAPNFSQLYSPGFGGQFAGNPDLDPERSWSTEVGADFTPGAGHRFTLSAYSTRVEDLIDFAGPDFRAINIRKARIDGIELTHRFAHAGWSSELNATWQDPQDRDADQDLLRRAGEKYSWIGGYRFDAGHSLSAELVHIGTRLDVGAVRLPSYTLVNLRAAVALGDHWQGEVRIDNLANRDYEPLFGFNGADRRVFAALVWRQ